MINAEVKAELYKETIAEIMAEKEKLEVENAELMIKNQELKDEVKRLEAENADLSTARIGFRVLREENKELKAEVEKLKAANRELANKALLADKKEVKKEEPVKMISTTITAESSAIVELLKCMVQ